MAKPIVSPEEREALLGGADSASLPLHEGAVLSLEQAEMLIKGLREGTLPLYETAQNRARRRTAKPIDWKKVLGS